METGQGGTRYLLRPKQEELRFLSFQVSKKAVAWMRDKDFNISALLRLLIDGFTNQWEVNGKVKTLDFYLDLADEKRFSDWEKRIAREMKNGERKKGGDE